VHGFTGHPVQTWTHEGGNARHATSEGGESSSGEPPSKLRRLNPSSTHRRERSEPGASVCWPRDLLPKAIPHARVMTHGYDTHLQHILRLSLNQDTLYGIARDFLVALEVERRSDPSRPILFVVHSLGGNILKKTLRYSSRCEANNPHLRSVSSSTIGIIFFGTPHRSAGPYNFGYLQEVAQPLLNVAGISFSEQAIDALSGISLPLRMQEDAFSIIAQRHNWMIHSFQEEIGMLDLDGRKVLKSSHSAIHLPPSI
jgi:hypothetical protein